MFIDYTRRVYSIPFLIEIINMRSIVRINDDNTTTAHKLRVQYNNNELILFAKKFLTNYSYSAIRQKINNSCNFIILNMESKF